MPALGNVFHYEYLSENVNGIVTFHKCHLYKPVGMNPDKSAEMIIFDTLALTMFILRGGSKEKEGPFQFGII